MAVPRGFQIESGPICVMSDPRRALVACRLRFRRKSVVLQRVTYKAQTLRMIINVLVIEITKDRI